MACINMFNNDQQYSTMGPPRISFSNDFADSTQQQPIKHHDVIYREPPVSSDFAFSSISDHSMVSADEVFCKGKILPTTKTTLKDELLLVGDDDDYVSLTKTTTTGRWRERFGLKRSHISQPPKKHGGGTGDCLGRIDETMSFRTGDSIDMKGFY